MNFGHYAYVTSTQFCNWHFSPSELITLRADCNAVALKRLQAFSETNNAKSSPVGLDPDQELKIVKHYVYLMKILFSKFTSPQLPNEVYGFAVTYFKRFYLNHSVMDFYPRDIMLTCLYVACKAADFPIGLQTFISHIPRNQERYSYLVLNSELFLLESLGYDLWVFTPYQAFTGFVIDLVAYQRRICGAQDSRSDAQLVHELCKEGIDLINLWYQTDLCLTVHPSQFALAVLVELGHTRPQLDVEVFVRDELCGCDPIQKHKQPFDSEDEEEADVKPKNSTKWDPESRWKELSARLDFIRQTVDEFEFLSDLGPAGEEEVILDECRNPLYNVESNVYAEAKSKADSLMAMLE
uniref:Cyclin N-terminal domain-containing protein n=1 Tax=Trichobilharzia regenti TaxID=157069 RepID=A0AA85IPN4_TRIRE|nr:unnamed protein product [Trichobilharzia regenti]